MADNVVKGLTVKVSADFSELEDAIDRCTEKARALADELQRAAALASSIPIGPATRNGGTGR